MKKERPSTGRKKLPTWAKVVIIVCSVFFGAFAVLSVVIVSIAVVQTIQQQTHAPATHKQSQQATVQHAPAPKQTPSASIAPKQSTPAQPTVTHGIPHLGGPVSDFLGALGQPDTFADIKSTPGIYNFETATNNGQQRVAGVEATTLLNDKKLVDGVTIQANVNNTSRTDEHGDSAFTYADAHDRIMTFAPSDAHFVKKYVWADNTGFDMVYTSAQLARELPASVSDHYYIDAQGNAVQAGTFDVVYLYSLGDTQHIADCSMAPGSESTTHF